MTYNVVFHDRVPGRIPEERIQSGPFHFEHDEPLVIPQVGDRVSYEGEGEAVEFEVLGRHFQYSFGACTVNIEVGSVSRLHKALSLKE